MNTGKKEKIHDTIMEPLPNGVHNKRTVDCSNHGRISCYSMQSLGNIFSYSKNEKTKWSQTGKVNDVDTGGKENFLALAADVENTFVVWLDLRDKHNT